MRGCADDGLPLRHDDSHLARGFIGQASRVKRRMIGAIERAGPDHGVLRRRCRKLEGDRELR